MLQQPRLSPARTTDAEGHRTNTTVSGTTLEFFYDLNNRHVLTSLNSAWYSGEIFAGNWHLATYANNSTYFIHADWLGTVRVRTDPTGAVTGSYSSLPFGDCLSTAGGCPGAFSIGALPSQFTDQDRDSETGLDHFMFRQYSSVQGRWMRPDPVGIAAADPGNPQTWNRYAYLSDSPTSTTDLLGLADCREAKHCPANGGGRQFGALEWCQLDGVTSICRVGGSYATVECPNDACLTVNYDGQPQYFAATANGSGAYYSYSGPGSAYQSADAAGTAGSLQYIRATAGDLKTAGDARERFGNVYVDGNGLYSYNFTAIGNPCDAYGSPCETTVNDIVPYGTTKVADWHTHPYDWGVDGFGDPNDKSTPGDRWGPRPYPGYVAAPMVTTQSLSYSVFRIGTVSSGQFASMCQVYGSAGYPSVHSC